MVSGTSGVLKVCDYGFCVRPPMAECLQQTFCGSRSYSSPQVLMGQAYNPFKVTSVTQ